MADNPSNVTVDAKKILARIERLRSSSLTVSIYLIPLIFLALAPVVWFVSGSGAGTVVGQILETLFQSFLLSLLLAFALYYGLMQSLGVYERSKEILVVEGQLHEAELIARPRIWGGSLTKFMIKHVLCIIWEPMAHAFGRKVPVLAVRYRFAIDGVKHERTELFYSDEIISEDGAGRIFVLVDPRAAKNRSFLLRVAGEFEDCPLK